MSGNVSIERFVLEPGGDLFIRGSVYVQPDQDKKPVIVICHGFKAFASWGFFPYAAEWLVQRGFYVVLFNFSCNGVREWDFDELDKFARNTYSREQDDLAAVLSALTRGRLPFPQMADTERIALLGHSRGGGNAIIFAADHPEIGAVVTWNGVGSANLFDERFEAEARREGVAYTPNARTKQLMPINRIFFEDLDRNRERFDIPARLAELDIPVMLLQGDEDAERLLNGFRRMREAAPRHTYRTIAGAGHTFGAVHPFAETTAALEEALEATASFLLENLRRRSG
ncbi:alpha/beta hydrolase [Paenibacillus sp. 32O-W]|uniref:alpha/beta hydrolase family protein n=1 Tax=Paenibacillus sp. 32O-W TaxID=1695218 RepID=UPI0007220F8A|nr:alpha/beta fold hydrolase [Paenibacillus sp. 32O-W]ALS25967.1 alpha/beta hydrolase [Paenibacillus sp. 32O-W]